MYLFQIKELREDFIKSVIASVLISSVNVILHLYGVSTFYDNSDLITVVILALMTATIFFALIFHNLPENDKVRFMKLHPLYPYINHTFTYAMILLIITLILQRVMYVLNIKSDFYLLILIFFLTWSIVTTFRCLWLLNRMIDIVNYNR